MQRTKSVLIKLLTVICALCCVLALAVGLAACAGETGPQGEQGLQGEQGPKGEDGKDGTDGKDGKDGLTPRIGENGNWWVGDTDTGIKAQGPKGEDGKDGKDGQDGKDGDSGTWDGEFNLGTYGCTHVWVIIVVIESSDVENNELIPGRYAVICDNECGAATILKEFYHEKANGKELDLVGMHVDKLADGAEDSHSWVENTEIKPDCTNPGWTGGRYCEDCGYVEGAKEIKPNGHTPDEGHPSVKIGGENICLDGGVKVYYCTDCGILLDTLTEVVQPAGHHGHVKDKTWTITKEPTFTSTGILHGTCEVCGVEYDYVLPAYGADIDAVHALDQDNCNATVWTNVNTASCAKGGKETHTIRIYGVDLKIEHDAPMTYHKIDGKSLAEWEAIDPDFVHETSEVANDGTNWYIVKIDSDKNPDQMYFFDSDNDYATCEKTGTGFFYCDDCGLPIAVRTTRGHVYDNNSTTTIPADCVVPETMIYTCVNCKDVVTEYSVNAEAKGHDFTLTLGSGFTKENGGTATLKCATCGLEATITLPAINETTLEGFEIVVKDVITYSSNKYTHSATVVNAAEKTTWELNTTGNKIVKTVTTYVVLTFKYVEHPSENCADKEVEYDLACLGGTYDVLKGVYPDEEDGKAASSKTELVAESCDFTLATISNIYKELATQIVHAVGKNAADPNKKQISSLGTPITEVDSSRYDEFPDKLYANNGDPFWFVNLNDEGVQYYVEAGLLIISDNDFANCSTIGTGYFVCADCGQVITLYFLGYHTAGTETKVAATHSHYGYTWSECTDCGAVFVNYNANATGHSLQISITKNPTETETGVAVVKCRTCTYSVNVELPVLGTTGETELTIGDTTVVISEYKVTGSTPDCRTETTQTYSFTIKVTYKVTNSTRTYAEYANASEIATGNADYEELVEMPAVSLTSSFNVKTAAQPHNPVGANEKLIIVVYFEGEAMHQLVEGYLCEYCGQFIETEERVDLTVDATATWNPEEAHIYSWVDGETGVKYEGYIVNGTTLVLREVA